MRHWVFLLVFLFCWSGGNPAWSFDPLQWRFWYTEKGMYKLNLESGKYEYLGKEDMYGCTPELADLDHDRLFCTTFSKGFGTDGVKIFDLKKMKIVAVLPFAQTGEGDEIRLKVSPDGSRIWARWDEGGNPQDPESGESYTGVFDGKTYKLLQKDPNFLWPESFSEDGKEYYVYDSDAKVWKAFSVKTNAVLRVLKAKGPGGKLRRKIRLRAKPEALYTEDLETGEAIPGSVPRASFAFSPPIYGQFHLSPDAKKVMAEEMEGGMPEQTGFPTGKLVIGDLVAGTVTTVTLKLPQHPCGKERSYKCGQGALIHWCPDSSCFIYNTTEELITFSIPEKKIVKRVPIQYPPELMR